MSIRELAEVAALGLVARAQVLDLRKESNDTTTLSGHGTVLEGRIVDQSTKGVNLELGSDPVATGGEDSLNEMERLPRLLCFTSEYRFLQLIATQAQTDFH